MVSEETPLLSGVTQEEIIAVKQHETVYDRFSRGRKIFIVAIVSWTGLLPLFVGGSFMPSIPAIAKDLDSDPATITLAVSISVLAASIGSLIAASYSSYYGRKPVYMIGLPISVIGSIGTALATNVPQLLVCRFIQALGTSPGMSVGAGVVGDIYKLEERGTAMGVYFGACLLGPALAPFIGGIASHYASWRVLQLALGAAALIGWIIILIFYPETMHPGARGIEKWRADHAGRRFHWTWINPLKPLTLLRSPNLIAISMAGLTVIMTDYVLLVPLSLTLSEKYGFTNQAMIGLCYGPIGIGNIIGAPLAGYLSDIIVVRYRTKRGGIWYPEDRLRGTLIGAATFVPLSVLVAGFIAQWVHTTAGLVGLLICLLFNGIGVDLVFSPCTAYAVDLMHSRSAEAIAATNGLRAFMLSFLVSGIMPSIGKFGIATTNTMSAMFAWTGFLMLFFTIRYGDKMRAWVDIGYSTATTN